jgi:MEMO1 family protein
MQRKNTNNILIRPPVVAGTFYPDNSKELKETVQEFLSKAVIGKRQDNLKALILPHAGYMYSGLIAAYGYKIIKPDSFNKIILLGPSHHFSFKRLAAAPESFWETPLGKVKIISKDKLMKLKDKKKIIESIEFHQPEHCLEVQLPFLQMTLDDFQIFPLLTGDIDAKKAADILMPIIDKKTLLLISSDLSHYMPYSQAKMADKVTLDAILANDIARFNEYGKACGKKPIEILLEIAKRNKWQSKLLCAMNSGETVGGVCLPEKTSKDESQVVGYASIAFYE